VRDRFPAAPPIEAIVRPQGLARRLGPPNVAQRTHARQTLARRFGIHSAATLVLGAGYGDHRKGIDLFVAIGAQVMAALPTSHFVWVGGVEPTQIEQIRTLAKSSGFSGRFTFAPFTADLTPFLWGADLFALTSREDPFPTALLQAQDAGLPAVAFADAGGFEQFLALGGGALASFGDAGAFADTVVNILTTPDRHRRLSTAAAAAMQAGHGMHRYAFDLLAALGFAQPAVSVVVPNFNYARYLRRRLQAITQQTLPVYEIIVLDDCSRDDSVAVARDGLRDSAADWRVIVGEAKARTVFEQWRRGVQAARGEFVWIAEADDLSDPRFLAAVTPALTDPTVVMSYCQSRPMDSLGRALDIDYLSYLSDVDSRRWRRAYVADGGDEIRAALAIKNTIPNVSACVFRRRVLQDVLEGTADEIDRYTIAGDWVTYIRLLAHGRIAYDPRPLNHHRRHGASVTASALTDAEALIEIERVQALVRTEFALSQQTLDLASAYVRKLRTQFGITAGP
jgi:GT2 family glycosyltransferase